jgi:hypothetical protein
MFLRIVPLQVALKQIPFIWADLGDRMQSGNHGVDARQTSKT